MIKRRSGLVVGWHAWIAAATLLFPLSISAAPQTVAVEGALTGAGGTPAVDGVHKLTFALYAGEKDAQPAWSEGPLDVQVAGGRFHVALGASKPFDLAKIGAAGWLGVQVGGDLELPRRPLHAAPYALIAGQLQCSGCISADAIANGAIPAAKVGFNFAGAATKGGAALDLNCSNCVGVGELLFDGDVDLGGNSFKAKNVTLSGDLAAKTVTAASFVGDGSKLTGILSVNGACPSGQAVVGIEADGKLTCKSLASVMPSDGLDEISGGTLGTQFKDLFTAGGLPAKIPDNTGVSALADLTVGDLGKIETIRVEVEVANTDLSVVSIVLLPPGDKQKGFVLCDPCGSKDAKSLKTSYPDKSSIKSGDLATLLGTQAKGLWTLKVLDTGFCLPQAPGNAELCDTQGKTDGTLVAFRVEVGTLSTTKVGAFAPLQLHKLATVPYPCDAVAEGSMFYDKVTHRIRFCDGQVWRSIADACGNGVLEPGEQCDDGNNQAGDGCSEICQAALGMGAGNPATSCAAILEAWKKDNSTAKSGVYWLDTDGVGGNAAFRTQCEMILEGGGWTLLFNLDSGDNKRHTYDDVAFWTQAGSEGDPAQPLASGSKTLAFSTLGGKEVMIIAHDNGKEMARGGYDLLAAYQNKTLMALFSGGEATVSGNRKFQAGTVGATLNTKRDQKRVGDPFVDPNNGEPLVINKQSGWSSNANKTRLMTTATNGQYGHTFSGIGGHHIHSGWGMNFESAPIASYCDCTNLYGNANNLEGNGQGTTLAGNGGCYDPGIFKFLPVDLAVYIR